MYQAEILNSLPQIHSSLNYHVFLPECKQLFRQEKLEPFALFSLPRLLYPKLNTSYVFKKHFLKSIICPLFLLSFVTALVVLSEGLLQYTPNSSPDACLHAFDPFSIK